jgi:predicted ArsR family transcriptional regulator
MTVRQHLAILERDNLISLSEHRKGPGRPSHIYSVSPAAEALFPKGYDRLAGRLLREISSLQDPEFARLPEREKIAVIFRQMAERQAEEYGREIRGASLEERGPQITALLRDREGTRSEWVQTEKGFLIQDCNCPFRNVALEEPELCTWHTHLLTRTLRAEVQMESCIAQGDACCRFRVESPAQAQRQEAGASGAPAAALATGTLPRPLAPAATKPGEAPSAQIITKETTHYACD